MARKTRLLILALLAAGAAGQAQSPVAAPEAGAGGNLKKRQERRQVSPEIETVLKALEALTPEQRLKFRENFLRWSNLPPEEKKALRDRDDFRRKRIAEDVEAALREAGLPLDEEHREQFIKRYTEERRKVEEQLRKLVEEKRRPMLKELQERLKAEFSAPENPHPSSPPITPITPIPPIATDKPTPEAKP